MEEEKNTYPKPSVGSKEAPPSCKTRRKAPAPELSFDFLLTPILKLEGARNSARLQDNAYVTEV